MTPDDIDEEPCGVCAAPIDLGGDAYQVVALEPDHAAPVCRVCLAALERANRAELARQDREAVRADMHLPSIEEEVTPWW